MVCGCWCRSGWAGVVCRWVGSRGASSFLLVWLVRGLRKDFGLAVNKTSPQKNGPINLKKNVYLSTLYYPSPTPTPTALHRSIQPPPRPYPPTAHPTFMPLLYGLFRFFFLDFSFSFFYYDFLLLSLSISLFVLILIFFLT